MCLIMPFPDQCLLLSSDIFSMKMRTNKKKTNIPPFKSPYEMGIILTGQFKKVAEFLFLLHFAESKGSLKRL